MTSADLLGAGAARHGFFSRKGGVSDGCYATLNAGPGSDDNAANVIENRRRCAEALGVASDHLLTLHQVHSATAVFVDGPWAGAPPKADAMVTTKPGLALGVLAADCMPWLLCDPHARVAAAAHAGWRGALAGVLGAAVEMMCAHGATPDNIRAALGPCLRQPNFEVGPDLVEMFENADPGTRQFFAPGAHPDKRQFDLAGFGKRALRQSGVGQIEDIDVCTLADPERYFSYRASQRAGETDYGRNLSAIVLL